VFHVSSFWLEIAYSGPNFWGLGVNRGQISIFHFITAKGHILARFRVFWAIARQNSSRGLFSTLVRGKKKVTQKVIFHPFAQKSPVNGFLPNLEQMFLSWT